MADNLQSLQKKYDEAYAKSKEGDKSAFKEKALLGSQLREAQREINRQGKRSLQEEYVRKFDNEQIVEIAPKAGAKPEPTTLQQHHSKRVLKRSS
jgi:hypothetical protein